MCITLERIYVQHRSPFMSEPLSDFTKRSVTTVGIFFNQIKKTYRTHRSTNHITFFRNNTHPLRTDCVKSDTYDYNTTQSYDRVK